MSNIIGTIINVKSYLSTKEIKIISEHDGEGYSLCKDRRYVIPDYQREIRWEKENIIELIMDLKSGDKFLGNIILSKNGNDYYLIDGQQRTTILLMIIFYINKKFGKKIEIELPCTFLNQSFTELEVLLQSGFDVSNEEKERILLADNFNQYDRYESLWNYISESNVLDNQYDAEKLYKNIGESEVNIIINRKDNLGTSIEYFLDVNLKGVKLDSEDIFKCYLFSKDTTKDIRDKWKKLKNCCFDLEKQNVYYPLMKILYQYFTCNLYKYDSKFRDFKFSEELTLSTFKEGDRYYKGQHLIQVINDKSFMSNSIDEVIKYLEILRDIVSNDDQTSLFKQYFSDLNDIERKLIFRLIKILLKDSNIIPKIFLMKYFISCVFDNARSKSNLGKIYIVFYFVTFYNTFEGKKDREKVYNLVKTDNWDEKLIEQLKYYFSNTNITKTLVGIQYKFTLEGDDDERYRCKSLAAIFNYFNQKNNKITISNKEELLYFITNDRDYSIEHFIIPNNKNCTIKIDHYSELDYPVPKGIRKYKNSIFNFIFIDKDMNRELGNYNLIKKISLLESYQFKCQYSKMIFEILKSIIQNDDIEQLKNNLSEEKLDVFFEEKFMSLYLKYVEEIFSKIAEKVNV